MSETKRLRADELKPGDVCKDGTVKSVGSIKNGLVRITFCDGTTKNIAGDWIVSVIAPDSRDALIARLRAENVALHKVVIDAMTIAFNDDPKVDIEAIIDILDTAPEPSDETLAIIEATNTGGDDA